MNPIRQSLGFLLITLSILAFAITQSGCAAWQQPENLEQKIAYAYSVHTAVLNATASAVEADSLSPEDGQQVQRLAQESRVLLDASRAAAGAGDITTAQGQLALATNILQQLQAYLKARSEQ